MITTTATDIQNNFGKYLKAVQEGNEIIILKKGKEVARLISKDTGISFLTDSLTGILKKIITKRISAQKGLQKNMKILIDTNVILDVLYDRTDFVESSSKIWKLCEVEKIDGYISALSIPNIVYILRKELTPEKTQQIIEQLFMIFHIADLKSSDIRKAANMKTSDYEDAIQMVCAQRMKVDFIVTRNIKDFIESKVPAMKPDELLERI